jgi:competence protein ComEA
LRLSDEGDDSVKEKTFLTCFYLFSVFCLLFLCGFIALDSTETDIPVLFQASALPSAVESPTPSGSSAPAQESPSSQNAPEEPAPGRININTAGTDSLCSLPGIGEVLAERIIEYRSAIGGFSSLEELMEVKGIGEKKFAAIKDLITL